jgi:hypothetical protein
VPTPIVKARLRDGIRRLPGGGAPLFAAWRELARLRARLDATLQAAWRSHLPHPDTIYWIPPQAVVRHTDWYPPGRPPPPPKDRVFDPRRHRGRTIGGDWDLGAFEFANLDVYRALERRIRDGASWESTELHTRLRHELDRDGRTSWYIASRRDLDAHFARLDALVASIARHGVLPSRDTAARGRRAGAHPACDSDIEVNVGRDGDWLFQDGRHRLAIARLLSLPRVPVQVVVRHSQWAAQRERLRAAREGRADPTDVGPADHPDLADLRAELRR